MSEIQKLVHKLLQTVVKYNSIISLNVGRTPPTPTTPMPEVLVVGLKGPTSAVVLKAAVLEKRRQFF